jgi:hypothetical protein
MLARIYDVGRISRFSISHIRFQRGIFMRLSHVLWATFAPLFLSAPANPHKHVDPDGGTVAPYPSECRDEEQCNRDSGGSIGSHACGFRITLRVALATLVVLLPAIPAKAHEHVNADGSRVSWYPKECCRDKDCRPVATVKKAPQGLWLTTVDGQTVLIGPRDQRRPSGDRRWHICVGTDDVDSTTPKILCIFEPANS